jgi:hypothetical protein
VRVTPIGQHTRHPDHHGSEEDDQSNENDHGDSDTAT